MDRYTLSSSFTPQSRVYFVLVIFLEGYVILSVLILVVCIFAEYGKFVFAYTLRKLLYLFFGQGTIFHFLSKLCAQSDIPDPAYLVKLIGQSCDTVIDIIQKSCLKAFFITAGIFGREDIYTIESAL